MSKKPSSLGSMPIRAVGISKSFPGVQALNSVSLTLEAGEVHALTGENGSGKSTLAKILAGLQTPDDGHIEIAGRRVSITKPAHALQYGIVTISQELTLAPTLTVAENILLNRQPRRKIGGAIDWRECRALARQALARLNPSIDEHSIVGQLSIEEQQLVEIARALSRDAKLLILDEATSSLSEQMARKVLGIVGQLRDLGVAVLIISHRMPEIYSVAAKATVLRDGRHIDTVLIPATPERELVRLMVGREIGDYYGARSEPIGKKMVEVRDLSVRSGLLAPTSFDVSRGEIVGVAGLMGSGKSELAQALGCAVRSVGTISIDGRQVVGGTPRTAITSGIAYIPDDRKRSAILASRSVVENLELAWFHRMSRFGVLPRRKMRVRARAVLTSLGANTSIEHVPIAQLSGGNQQKLVLGRTFANGCKLLVLNEPTRGIDIAAKRDIYNAIREQARAGCAIVFVSSELPELLGVADRILVLHQGTVAAEFLAHEANEHLLATAALSGKAHASATERANPRVQESGMMI